MFALIAIALILAAFTALAVVLAHADKSSAFDLRVADALTPAAVVYNEREALRKALDAHYRTHTRTGRMVALLEAAEGFTGSDLVWFSKGQA